MIHGTITEGSEAVNSMNEIVEKEVLAPGILLFRVSAPEIARRAEAGQFVVVRVSETGERIPLTIADFDREQETITMVFMQAGKTSRMLGTLDVGDRILDVVGPLGRPSDVEYYGRAICVGGGYGVAPVFPIARALKQAGNQVIGIIGARTEELIIFEKEMASVCDRLLISTDDGSRGHHGLVTDVLKIILEDGQKTDLVVAIGPAIMMKFVSLMTKSYGVKTLVSLNALMVDATGMCGVCRVSVGGKTFFSCVDGPEFDGHQVDYDELMARQSFYLEEEKIALERYVEECRGDKRCLRK